MTAALLLTQCLQNDFVQPLARYDPLPNKLHIGHAESLRLMGADPPHGPVAHLMAWACRQPDEELRLVHIRDWHDPADPGQAAHLRRFGLHCIRVTEGARFVFDGWPGCSGEGKSVEVIDALTLNDFQGTRLKEVLAPFAGLQDLPVGLVGVWTEAKISFLAYELATRYPGFRLGICSALVASNSRKEHFRSLEQLDKLLDVELHASVGSFIRFLGGESGELALPGLALQRHPRLSFEQPLELSATDEQLLRYLFRDSREVSLRVLDGGYSGNVVLGCQSTDVDGHREMPHVVKIGKQEAIGQERDRFLRVESVMGNAAPSIARFADLGLRGAIKYRYASMRGAFSTTFQKLYMQGVPLDRVRGYLDVVFGELLGRFYAARTSERVDLLELYTFDSRYASNVRARVRPLLDEGLPFDPLRLVRFYEEELDRLPRDQPDYSFLSYVHGDLNGANIIVDDQDNVWLIDFFHTGRGHVLQDLIKLENDLLYIFTPLADDAAAGEARRLTDLLLETGDLAAPLPPAERTGLTEPGLVRAWETLRHLRGFYPELVESDRNVLQLQVGMLRYATHTLAFDESDRRQKQWALYTACACAERIVAAYHNRGPLRIDWIDAALTAPGRLGLTLLPGRRDYHRDLERDLRALREAGVTCVVSLLPDAELAHYGVERLPQACREAGLEHHQLPVVDQRVPAPDEMRELAAWLDQRLRAGDQVLLHCTGGLGRSGTAAACYLKTRGLDTAAALAAVRQARSPRAVESPTQEAFVAEF